MLFSHRRAHALCFWYFGGSIARATASCRYRIGNLVEELRATSVLGERLPEDALIGSRVLSCPRPWVDEARARELEGLRRRGLFLVADFDDLLFDGDRAEARIAGYRRALQLFDAFTVSTAPLAEHVTRHRPDARVHVVPNGVSRRWVRQGELLYPRWRPGDVRVIRYLPGSPSHDLDFELVREPLRAFLADHPDTRFEVLGPLRWDHDGFPPPPRVAHHPRVPYAHFAGVLASSWVSLAPLAPTEVNRCKSAIKYLESGAFGCPTIASPHPDLEAHAAGGALLARTPDEWYRALVRLRDDDTRMALGAQAETQVMAHGTAEESASALSGALESWSDAWDR